MTEARRRKILRLSVPGFLAMVRGAFPPAEVIADPVPADARVVDVRLAPWGLPETLEVLLESDAFDPVPDGEVYPVLSPMYRRTYAGHEVERIA
jgi:hypothetical protein